MIPKRPSPPIDPSQEAEQSLAQERANILVHALGVILALVATALLVSFASIYGTVWHIVGVAVFGATLILLYLVSTVYHWVGVGPAKEKWRLADHGAIFLLIAGTYTPFTFVTLQGSWGWWIFGIEWGLAILGIGLTLFSRYRHHPSLLWIYLGMGWVVVVAAFPLIRALPVWGLVWLVAGGLAYSLGTIFFRYGERGYNHAIWHGFVLLGSTCHFFAILFYVIPSA